MESENLEMRCSHMKVVLVAPRYGALISCDTGKLGDQNCVLKFGPVICLNSPAQLGLWIRREGEGPGSHWSGLGRSGETQPDLMAGW